MTEGISATANDDGSITLEWEHYGSENYAIYRSVAGEDDFEVIGNTLDNTFTDTETEEGVTYDYRVEAEPQPGPYVPYCIQVTAIPFFGAPILGAVAAIGAVGAYAWIGRRKA